MGKRAWPESVKSKIMKGLAGGQLRYTPMRMLQTVADFAVLLSALGLMVSGIILSREVFAFLPISGGIAMARPLHVLSAFWGFAGMAFRLGLHWNMVLAMARNAAGKETSKTLRMILRITAVLAAGYGLYAFIKNQFLSYMFLASSFVFFDFERPVPLFFTEYIAAMGLMVFLAHYVSKGFRKLSGRSVK